MLCFEDIAVNQDVLSKMVRNSNGTFTDEPPIKGAGYAKPVQRDSLVWYRRQNGVYYYEPVLDDCDYQSPIENILMAGLPAKKLFGASWADDRQGHLHCSFSDGVFSDKYAPEFRGKAKIAMDGGHISEAEMRNHYCTIRISASNYVKVADTYIPRTISTTSDSGAIRSTTKFQLLLISSPAKVAPISPPASKIVEDYRVNGPDLTSADVSIDLQMHPRKLKEADYAWSGKVPPRDAVR